MFIKLIFSDNGACKPAENIGRFESRFRKASPCANHTGVSRRASIPDAIVSLAALQIEVNGTKRRPAYHYVAFCAARHELSCVKRSAGWKTKGLGMWAIFRCKAKPNLFQLFSLNMVLENELNIFTSCYGRG